MPKSYYEGSVFTESVERIAALYREGHRVVVSFSAGKDSGVVLEVAVIAAKQEGCLPVEAVIRDEEIMFPGTFEYAERVHARKDVNLHWLVANQPIINVFNRECPYWWVFDPLLKPEEWVRVRRASQSTFLTRTSSTWLTLNVFHLTGANCLFT